MSNNDDKLFLIVCETPTVISLYLGKGRSEKEVLSNFYIEDDEEDLLDDDDEDAEYWETVKAFPFSQELLLKYLKFDNKKITELVVGIYKEKEPK